MSAPQDAATDDVRHGRGKAAKAARMAKEFVRVGIHRLPAPLSRRIIRRRHLQHVSVNMLELTPAAFLRGDDFGQAAWRDSDPLASHPDMGLGIEPLHEKQIAAVTDWLRQNLCDSDAELERRMDNANDEFGRVRAALRTRVHAAKVPEDSTPRAASGTGARVLIDARSLQTSSFAGRGIGRFARSCLDAVRATMADSRITLLVDRSLPRLSSDVAGDCEQTTWITSKDSGEFALLVQPSPMTHDPEPLLHVLTGEAESLAIVFDFIPLHFPSVYLRFTAERAEYLRNLDALRLYKEYACISHTVRDELLTLFPAVQSDQASVAWPEAVAGQPHAGPRTPVDSENRDDAVPVVVMTGDDARKNTFGGLAGVAAATSHVASRNVVVLGMNTGDDRVHHWSIAAAMRPGEAIDSVRLSDEEMVDLLASAGCVVVPSFDEGLSLPVIEALGTGTPVVASNILAHRELIGNGRFLFDPRDPSSIAKAFDWVLANPGVAGVQQQRLANHQHLLLEDVVASAVQRVSRDSETNKSTTINVDTDSRTRPRLKVAVAAPWPPQASGVADYSAATIRALAELCDVTVFTTSGADVQLQGVDSAIHDHRNVDAILADPELIHDEFDVVLSVVGNSHFHLPFVALLGRLPCVVIAHDTRMTEYYLALRDRGGLEQVMLRTAVEASSRGIYPSLDDQVEDLRLMQNAAMWEVANQSRALILHSPTAAPAIAEQTEIPPIVLPFAHYRPLEDLPNSAEDRLAARRRLGLDDEPECLRLATFGYVDLRTKQVDTVLEAAGWLTSWGFPVAFHIVGSAHPEVRDTLERRASELHLRSFSITGYQDEVRYRDWLVGVDLGVQLRISPLLGVSGPLADMAVAGTPAVASEGLCADVGAPTFITPLPNSVSPVTLAQAILAAWKSPNPESLVQKQRQMYLSSHAPERYAEQLLNVLEEVAA